MTLRWKINPLRATRRRIYSLRGIGVNLPVMSFVVGILIQFPCSKERPEISMQVSTSLPYISLNA
jgi:hypothetical protein